MKKGLSKAGIGPVDEALLIQKAAVYGFDAVDMDVTSLISNIGMDGARELLERSGVVVGACDLKLEWRKSDSDFHQGLQDLASYAAAASELGCRAFCTYILPSTDAKPAAFMAQAIKRLKICAEILGMYGIRLGLEFVGPHHLRTAWKHPFIWTMEETLEMIEAIGLSNVGLLVDTYHCYTTGVSAADLLRLHAEQVVHVHINDAHQLPVEQLLDNDRLYPGEGVIDLPGMLRSLQQIGYDGIIAQEILMPKPLNASVDELLERSRSGFIKVFAQMATDSV